MGRDKASVETVGGTRGVSRWPPAFKRTVVFIDGQNLFHAAREAFGDTYPNYDVHALALRLCDARGWQLVQTHFYTGIPDSTDNRFWHRRRGEGRRRPHALDVIRMAHRGEYDVGVIASAWRPYLLAANIGPSLAETIPNRAPMIMDSDTTISALSRLAESSFGSASFSGVCSRKAKVGA